MTQPSKEYLCDSCYNAEITTVEIYKPRFKFSCENIKTKHLAIWCKDKCHYVQKMVTVRERKKCNYRPKNGKIGKRLYQKQLGE
jgi:hypothetical protein